MYTRVTVEHYPFLSDCTVKNCKVHLTVQKVVQSFKGDWLFFSHSLCQDGVKELGLDEHDCYVHVMKLQLQSEPVQ